MVWNVSVLPNQKWAFFLRQLRTKNPFAFDKATSLFIYTAKLWLSWRASPYQKVPSQSASEQRVFPTTLQRSWLFVSQLHRFTFGTVDKDNF